MGAPTVQGPLVGFEWDEPAHGDQLLSRMLDASQADAKNFGDPRRLGPTSIEAFSGFEVKSADQMSEDGGDESGPRAARQKPKSAAGDRDLAVRIGDLVEESP